MYHLWKFFTTSFALRLPFSLHRKHTQTVIKQGLVLEILKTILPIMASRSVEDEEEELDDSEESDHSPASASAQASRN